MGAEEHHGQAAEGWSAVARVEHEVSWPQLRELAQLAEEVGLDSILGRRPLPRSRCPGHSGTLGGVDPTRGTGSLDVAAGARAAGRGDGLSQSGCPGQVAATVDEISANWLILGIGAGWNATEFAAFGFPYDDRVSRFEKAFTIMRTLLRDGHIDFEGRFYTCATASSSPVALVPAVLPC
jgi:alkanesulfonate monooxygenase SsuD/methylene tetrahydromethanopterin reductase-like flavin-dependent oxidoreductase (luciferase family)